MKLRLSLLRAGFVASAAAVAQPQGATSDGCWKAVPDHDKFR
ncbi:hypothetical protein [Comamonas badia]|nr:hypothetical protein [Comamonas badia]